MHRVLAFFLALVSVLAFCGFAFADVTVGDLAKSTVVSGRFFIGFEDGQLSGNKPEFVVSRAYIDLKRDIDSNMAVRLTTDVDRSGTIEGDTRYEVFLKYAYFDFKNLGVPVIGLDTLRAGQSPTNWINIVENYWNYRYVQKTMMDYFGVYSTADLGVSALGSLNLGVPGLTKVDYQGTIMNGSGYKSAETNYQKDYALSFKTDAISWGEKDKVSAAVDYYIKDLGGAVSPITVVNALFAVQSTFPARWILFAEYGNPTDKLGFSVGGQYEVLPKVNLFGRLDSFDPNTNVNGNEKNLDIGGLEYGFSDSVKMSLDYQNELTAGTDTMKKASVHFDIKW